MNEEYFLHYDINSSKILKKNTDDKRNLFYEITNIKIENYGKEKIINRQLSSFNFIPHVLNPSNFLKVYEKLIIEQKEKESLYSELPIINENSLILNRNSINYIITVIKGLIGKIKHNIEFENKIYNFAFLGNIPTKYYN